MGADIHTYIEKNVDGKWEPVRLYYKEGDNNYCDVMPYSDRNYELFSILAGVRGWNEPLVDPRSLPHNLSEYVQREYDKGDGYYHTPTWYDLRELDMYAEIEGLKPHEDDDFSVDFLNKFVDDCKRFILYAGEWFWDAQQPGKYRVIMWFDS